MLVQWLYSEISKSRGWDKGDTILKLQVAIAALWTSFLLFFELYQIHIRERKEGALGLWNSQHYNMKANCVTVREETG